MDRTFVLFKEKVNGQNLIYVMKHVFLPEQASNEKKFIPLRP
ncbi:hypothetical protein BFO_0262 [Tannerella forsythia 92A2]|uniref:Uncharacterized protein n=1 Tax=Tannerella forsythia (strain ATCC 43037 / JCM 10827 / CCUG 21028 A / KCTC 5666 / FDC 338) TaxID=203275 RepID=G8UJI9_TANFA|nr:hypothetical protein BFO_0262 [Tannerella forsythia 92A2]BAR47829.1 hypothetical protein TF3313_0227 [Tannerella forsythia 3313]